MGEPRLLRTASAAVRLKKSFRRHLRANNQSLVGCDVANSQPLLVGLLCRHLKQGFSSIKLSNFTQSSQFDHYVEIDQDFLDHLSHNSPEKQEEQEEQRGEGERDSLYDVVFTKSSQSLPEDLERYLKLCEEGRFYDELMALDDNPTDRETFKKQVFTQVFYGKNCYEGRLTRLFAKEFPTIWDMIRTIKKLDYHRLSHHMLRLESEVVINRAVRRCALEGVLVVTIHDCLVTYPENVERAAGSWKRRSAQWASDRPSRSRRLIGMSTVFAVGLLGLWWTGRASLFLELTGEAVGVLARSQENRSSSV